MKYMKSLTFGKKFCLMCPSGMGGSSFFEGGGGGPITEGGGGGLPFCDGGDYVTKFAFTSRILELLNSFLDVNKLYKWCIVK